jgi:hypothetical protein
MPFNGQFLKILIFNELLQITMRLQNLNFYVFGYIWISQMVKCFHFFKIPKFGGTNTMCYIKLFPRTFGVMAKIQCDNIKI